MIQKSDFFKNLLKFNRDDELYDFSSNPCNSFYQKSCFSPYSHYFNDDEHYSKTHLSHHHHHHHYHDPLSYEMIVKQKLNANYIDTKNKLNYYLLQNISPPPYLVDEYNRLNQIMNTNIMSYDAFHNHAYALPFQHDYHEIYDHVLHDEIPFSSHNILGNIYLNPF